MRIAGLLLAALTGVATVAFSQTSITDFSTPPEVAAGVPSGSYVLSNLDTVDPYSGSLNVHIPLLQVGGRGEAGYTISLIIQRKWQTATHTNATGNPYLYPGDAGWSPVSVSYIPGSVMSRQSTDPTQAPIPCTSGSAAGYTFFTGELLTRLTFTDENGTEHELVDQQNNGQPLNPYPAPYYTPNCSMDPVNGGTNRGTIFVSTDASNIRFVSDQSIHDQVAVGTRSILIPKRMTGWLYFPNGRRYRVDNGIVSSIVDRNGNITSISSSASPISITDPLNRHIQISVGGSPGTSDIITYPGYAGASRQITIAFTTLSAALAPGQSLQRECPVDRRK